MAEAQSRCALRERCRVEVDYYWELTNKMHTWCVSFSSIVWWFLKAPSSLHMDLVSFRTLFVTLTFTIDRYIDSQLCMDKWI